MVGWTAPNGTRYLLTGSPDGKIYFVDSETGEVDEERTLDGHEEVRIMMVVCLCRSNIMHI